MCSLLISFLNAIIIIPIWRFFTHILYSLCTCRTDTSFVNRDDVDESSLPTCKLSFFRSCMYRLFPSIFPLPVLYQARIEPERTAAKWSTGKRFLPCGRSSTFADHLLVYTTPGFEVTAIRFPRSGQTFTSEKKIIKLWSIYV